MTIDSPAALNRESVADRRAQFRYGAVFLLTLAAVVFVIAAPSADWSRAVTLAIESAALVVAVATSRERERVRHRRALAVGVVMIVLILGVGIGAVSEQLTAILLALVTGGRSGGDRPWCRPAAARAGRHPPGGGRGAGDLSLDRPRVRLDHQLHHSRRFRRCTSRSTPAAPRGTGSTSASPC